MKLYFPFLILPLLLASKTSPASADPWLGWNEDRVEDHYVDGDIDTEDLIASHFALPRGHGRAPSWVSLVGFTSASSDGSRAYGGMAVVGLALDSIAAGSQHRIAERPDAQPPIPEAARVLINPSLARAAVAAAWRTAGLGAVDDRIDSMLTRARFAAALPETRLRMVRAMNESGRTDAFLDQARSYDTAAAQLLFEARMTWRFDRLLYGDDEPTLERLRIEGANARARLAARILEALFQWQRARMESDPSEASLRVLEAEIVLDVLTGGWFTARARGAG